MEEQNEKTQVTEQDNGFDGYNDPLAKQSEAPKKKKSSETVIAGIVSVVVFFLFGAVGGLICFGGYYAVQAIARSKKLSLSARIALSIIVGLVFLVLLIAFILFAASLRANNY